MRENWAAGFSFRDRASSGLWFRLRASWDQRHLPDRQNNHGQGHCHRMGILISSSADLFDVKGEHGEIQHWGSELGPTPLIDEENERRLEQRLNEARRPDYPHLQPPQSDFGRTSVSPNRLFINGKELLLTGNPPTAEQPPTQ